MPETRHVFGNFEQFGKWSEPDPSFDGYIIVDDDGKFVGYLDELYGPVADMESLCNSLNNLRFITGYIANNGKDGAEGICYLKLSQDINQSPLLYVIPNLDQEGEWGTMLGVFEYFNHLGCARVSLEKVAESDVINAKINNLHGLIRDGNSTMNNSLLDQSDVCLGILQNIE